MYTITVVATDGTVQHVMSNVSLAMLDAKLRLMSRLSLPGERVVYRKV